MIRLTTTKITIISHCLIVVTIASVGLVSVSFSFYSFPFIMIPLWFSDGTNYYFPCIDMLAVLQ